MTRHKTTTEREKKEALLCARFKSTYIREERHREKEHTYILSLPFCPDRRKKAENTREGRESEREEVLCFVLLRANVVVKEEEEEEEDCEI